MNNGKWIKGFSLIELLTVVSLLGILAATSVPAYDYIMNRKRLEMATEDLYNLMILAHSQSLERQSNYYISFKGGANWCYGVDDTAACDCSIANDCQVGGIETVKKSTDYNNISLAVTGFSGGGIPYVQFEGLRGIASSSGSVTLSLSGLSTTMTSNKIGLVSLCSNQIASYTSCP